MRIKIAIVLLLVLLAGWWAASGQTIIGRPLMPLQSATELPLDAITNQPFSAFSFARKLRSAYVGDAFVVIRSSDLASTNIGFVGGLVDTNALASFVGVGDGMVRILYDQGTGSNLIQNASSAQQPLVVIGGALQLDDNGYLRASFTGSNPNIDSLTSSSSPGSPATNHSVVVFSITTDASATIACGLQNNYCAIGIWAGQKIALNNGAGLTVTTLSYNLNQQYLAWAKFTDTGGAGADDCVYLNDQAPACVAAGLVVSMQGQTLGYSTTGAQQYLSEWYVINTEVTEATQSTLTDNINAFYSLW